MNDTNNIPTKSPLIPFSEKPMPLPVGARLEGVARTQLLELSAAAGKPHNQLVRELLTEALTRPIDWRQIREDLEKIKQDILRLQAPHPVAELEERVANLAAALTRDQSAVAAAMRQLYQNMVGLEAHLNIELKQSHQAAMALNEDARQSIDTLAAGMNAQQSGLTQEVTSIRKEVVMMNEVLKTNQSKQSKKARWMWGCIGAMSVALIVIAGFACGIHLTMTARLNIAMERTERAKTAVRQTEERLHSESERAKVLANRLRILQFILDSREDAEKQ